MGILSEVLEVIRKLSGDPVVESTAHPSGDGRSLVVKQGYEIKQITGRRRGRRKHAFDDMGGFADWLLRHVQEGGGREACEILVDKDKIVASLTPRQRQSDEITCILVKDPTFEAWRAAFAIPELSQRDFYQLVRAHGSVLVERELLLGMLTQIDVTVHSEGGEQLTAAGLQALIKRSRTTNASITIPPSFNLQTPIIDGLENTYDLEVFLTASVKEGPALVFKLDCPGLDLVQRQVRRDVAAHLEETLLSGGGFLVGLGTLATEEVPEIQAAS